MLGASVEDRFWAKVDKNGQVPSERPSLGPCWIWTAAITTAGYGAFNLPHGTGEPQRQDFAHIWAWKRYIGPIPEGYQLDHLCHTVDLEHCNLKDNCPHRACVNYETHLELVTPAENTMRSHSWAATKKQQVSCLRGHLLVAPNLLPWRTDGRACKSCGYTYQQHHYWRKRHPTVEFDFQAESDRRYNRLMGIIPEQGTRQRRPRTCEPSSPEALKEVETMIQNLENL